MFSECVMCYMAIPFTANESFNLNFFYCWTVFQHKTVASVMP